MKTLFYIIVNIQIKKLQSDILLYFLKYLINYGNLNIYKIFIVLLMIN